MVKTRITRLLVALSLAASLAVLPACSSPSTSSASSSAATTTSQSQAASASSQGSTQAADISVTVTIASPNTEGFEAIEEVVSVDEGASALDALQAATPDVVVEDGQYGAFVTNINGLANGSAGAQSGWTYTVNGEYVPDSAADYTLADGDTVAWEFYV